MEKHFTIIKKTRENFLKLIEGLTIEELNSIPENFNNNIIWNLGHLIRSQQVLCYILGNETPKVDEDIVLKYGKGTKPEAFIDENELKFLKENLVSNIESLEQDYNNGLFKNFTSYTTSYGIELNTIEDAIKFIVCHEGLHFGYSMSLKRLVTQCNTVV